MSRYAEGTSVPVERSRAEIEALLRRYGADQFVSGWELGRAMIGFRCQDRFIRFVLAFPARDDRRFTHVKHKHRYFETERTERQAEEAYNSEQRRLWRALALVIKAKLEAVTSGITTFENEFMAHIVMPDGKTVGEHVRPAIETAYKLGRVPALLGLPAGDVVDVDP